MMITKKSNYEALYKNLNKKEPTENELKEFVPKVASSIEIATKSTVWYINSSKIKDYFNEETVDNVTAAINYPKALITKNYDPIFGMKDRRLYFNLLKKIINYDECKD
jgi:hypothetical protein